MALATFTIDPTVSTLTDEQHVAAINAASTQITRAGSVAATARPLVAGEVTDVELAVDSVTNPKIATGAVNTDELADDAVTGNRPSAIAVLTLAGQPLGDETVTIGAKVYRFRTLLIDQQDGDVLIGASASDSLDNLIAAIGLGAGVGTLYATDMTENDDVLAQAGAGDTMDVVAKEGGADGNSIATTETLTNGSWSGATLVGGSNAKMVISAARDSLTAMKDVDRKFVLTRPIVASGDFKILSMKRRSDGILEVEFDSVPA